jgi:methylmalonyl-CoA mutase N-terminal domain/subunit
MQDDARRYFERIDEEGGMITAIEKGFFRREIADAAFVYQREIDANRKLIVGVNAFKEAEEKPIDTLAIDEAVEREQAAALAKVKARRNSGDAERCLNTLRKAASGKDNLMPAMIEAAEARCTVGEIMAALGDVFGKYDGAAKW